MLCNPLYTSYRTLPEKDRLSFLRVLLDGADSSFRLNELALKHLERFGVARKWCKQLTAQLPHEQDCTESQLDDLLDQHLPQLKAKSRKLIKDAFAIAAYQSQTAFPVVELLICDDAPQFPLLTAEIALCWVHEYRHYKKLTPRIASHRHQMEDFAENFWKLYRQLLAYREHPNQQEAEEAQDAFERLFGQSSDYEQLDKRKALTLAKKEALLMVLSPPRNSLA